MKIQSGFNTRKLAWLTGLRDPELQGQQPGLSVLLCPRVLSLMVAKHLLAAAREVRLLVVIWRMGSSHLFSMKSETNCPRKVQELCPWFHWLELSHVLDYGLFVNKSVAGIDHSPLSLELRSFAKQHCPFPNGESWGRHQHVLLL